MRRVRNIVLTALCLATGVGCSNRIVGNNITQANTWQGELGITGHLNNITIKNGSNITKLSVIGDANKVRVEDRVTLGKVEVWGQRNKIYIPDYLVIRESIVGNGSEVVRVHPGVDQPFESAFPPEPPLASDTSAPTTTENAGVMTLETPGGD